jgi:DNA-binding HxlR family transcriptional regulator
MLKVKFDVYNEHCPSRNVLGVISDKWSILVINLLSKKIFRFGELKREIGGISPKMLAQTLKTLQRYGFISRQDYPGVILKVEYSLTSLGRELSLHLASLTDWTERNMQEIMHAVKKFDGCP